MHPWTYDEFKHIGVDFADPQQVARYDARQRTSIERQQQLVQRLQVADGDLVIEFGPGTGAFSMAAAMAGARVIAVDISESMLEYASRKATEMGLANIEFVHSGFLAYQHHGEPADFVVTQFAFHHLPDFWKAVAIRQFHDLLKPNGHFFLRDVVFSFDPSDYESAIQQWIDDIASDQGDGFSRADFEMHVRDEYSTFGWILEGMLQRAGFTVSATYTTLTYAEFDCIRA